MASMDWFSRGRAGRFLTRALALVPLLPSLARAGTDWLPARPVSLVVPSASLAPGQPRPLEILIRANGAPISIKWIATPLQGAMVPQVSATQGTLSLAADQTVTVPVTVTVPSSVTSRLVGYIEWKVLLQSTNGLLANGLSTIRAAATGLPELYPLPSTATAAAGGPGTVTFQLHSTIGTSELFEITITRTNPDPNNPSNLFPFTAPATPVTLGAGATLPVTVPLYLPGNAFPGNLNSFLVNATNTDETKLADARGHAIATSADPDSLPSTFYPIGLVPQSEPVASRDGPAPVPLRGLRLLPSGWDGVQVARDSALDRVGMLDLDANGKDERFVGNVHVPTYAAGIAVVPGFVTSTMEVLDLGLLAAGKGGLMLVDLRDIVEPTFGSWDIFYDVNGDGVDDRILRMIPMPGFATDVEWFRTPEGRVVALVAAADTGSVPVSAGYTPAFVVPGTGAGVVAVDVGAALDSLEGVPFMAGSLATPGTTLDLSLRGGPQPEVAIADGGGQVLFSSVQASGEPAVVTFSSPTSVSLSNAWGSAVARDLEWVPTYSDSGYLAVAAGAGGVQLLRAPRVGQRFLALAQRAEAAAIGLAATVNGNLAAALGASGATLLKLPWNHQLDQISPTSPAPYQAPVVLDVGTPWPGARPLRLATHGTTTSSITAARFLEGGGIPDLLCADGKRMLTLRPGPAAAVGVGPAPRADADGSRLRIWPNPMRGSAEVSLAAAAKGSFAPDRPFTLEIVDLQGRIVRRIRQQPSGASNGPVLRAHFDGRDEAGRPLAPGLYLARASQEGSASSQSPFVLLR